MGVLAGAACTRPIMPVVAGDVACHGRDAGLAHAACASNLGSILWGSRHFLLFTTSDTRRITRGVVGASLVTTAAELLEPWAEYLQYSPVLYLSRIRRFQVHGLTTPRCFSGRVASCATVYAKPWPFARESGMI